MWTLAGLGPPAHLPDEIISGVRSHNNKLISTVNTTERITDTRTIARHPQPPPTGRMVNRGRFCVKAELRPGGEKRSTAKS